MIKLSEEEKGEIIKAYGAVRHARMEAELKRLRVQEAEPTEEEQVPEEEKPEEVPVCPKTTLGMKN